MDWSWAIVWIDWVGYGEAVIFLEVASLFDSRFYARLLDRLVNISPVMIYPLDTSGEVFLKCCTLIGYWGSSLFGLLSPLFLVNLWTDDGLCCISVRLGTDKLVLRPLSHLFVRPLTWKRVPGRSGTVFDQDGVNLPRLAVVVSTTLRSRVVLLLRRRWWRLSPWVRYCLLRGNNIMCYIIGLDWDHFICWAFTVNMSLCSITIFYE